MLQVMQTKGGSECHHTVMSSLPLPHSYWRICTVGLQGKEVKEGVGTNGTGFKDTHNSTHFYKESCRNNTALKVARRSVV